MARYAPKGALLPELVVTPGRVSLMGIRASLQNRGFRFAAAYGRLVWAAVMVAGTFRQHFVVDSIPDVPPLDNCPRSAGEANARSRWLGRKEVSGFQPIKSVGTQTTVHHFAQTCASQTAIFLSGSGTPSFVLSKESVPAGPGAASPEIPAAGVAAYKAYPPWRDKK